MAYVGTGAYSHRIITPNERTQGIEYLEASAADHLRAAEAGERELKQREIANRLREEAIRSPRSRQMHTANRLGVAHLRNRIAADRGLAEMMEAQAEILREVDDRHREIDQDAHKQINAQTTYAEIEGIIDVAHVAAVAASTDGVQAFLARHTQWAKDHAGTYEMLATLLPANPPPIQPSPNPNPGAVRALDDKTGVKGGRSEGGSSTNSGGSEPGSQTGTDPSGTGGGGQSAGANGQRGRGERGLRQELAPGEPGESGPAPGGGPLPALPVSSLGGGSGGGLPGGGGLGGGGLGSGLGGGGPLLSGVAGVGSNPASSGVGSGIPTAGPMSNAASAAAGLGNPSGAFAQGLSSGGSGVSPVGAVPPPSTAAPSSVAGPAAGGGAPPVVGGGSPAGSVAAAGASGVQPVSAVGAVPGASGAVPAMLPSTGMGAPGPVGAPVSSVGSATTSPAGGSGGAGSAAGGGVPSGNAGPTLVPGAVVSPPDVGPGQRPLSKDARRAAKLAGMLQYQCRVVSFPIDWAVGVFLSGADEGSETVIVSAEGSSYVPAGVFVPRRVGLLVADRLVDKAFRDTWFGCPDPARVVVEYARLRRETGWELVAAATTGPTDYLRNYGVEHADSCVYPMSATEAIPGLDAMHVHRLQLEFSDLYDRLVRLAATEHGYSVAMAVARDLVDEASGLQHPIELAQMWSAVVAGQEPTVEQWQAFVELSRNEFVFTTPKRPPTCPVEVYRDAWVVGRALEVVGGFAARPLPLVDMVYAYSAAWPGVDVRRRVEPLLQQAEIEGGLA